MRKLFIIYTIIVLIVIVFIGRLAYLQLFTDRYKLNAYNTSIKQEIIHPNRGDIVDRNDVLLVSNSYSYELNILPLHLNKDFDTIAFCNLIKITPQEFTKRIQQITETKDFKRLTPYPFVKNIPREEYARIQAQLYLYPAVSIVKRPERMYMVKTAGNILGYINEANTSYIKKDSAYYQPGDLVGISGVEKSYENELRGVKGVKNYIADRTMNVVGPYKNGEYDKPVKSGKSLTLTIDYRLQLYAETLLSNKRGAIVAIEPATGEILALASSPTIDPKLFLNSVDRTKLIRDSINKPTFDRATQGTYPPGSTFKVITALAAMQMGTLSTSTTYVCKHGFRQGRMKIACHCGYYYRPITIEPAITRSCNNFFSETFRDIVKKDSTSYRTGLNEWAKIMNSFGLGVYLNNDLAVGNKGLIPDADFYDSRFGKGKWNPLSIIFNGMGQGEILTTPLQMANFVAIIANKGYFYTPHIVKKLEGDMINNPNFTVPKQTLVDSIHFRPIINGMSSVFTMGTARRFISPFFTQAGKTGTSENSHGKDHSLFVLMAPVENPKIVVAAIIENGTWGAKWAGPMSSLVAELYVTDTIRRKALETAMINGNLQSEYDKQWINHLKKKGLYVEPLKQEKIVPE